MCELTFHPAGIMPDHDYLRTAAEWNDDGHGFAIVAGNRLIVRKSMNFEELLSTFTKLRRKHLDGPAIFHSRLGTAGVQDTSNCHPFRVLGDRRTVVAHNGIFPGIVQPAKGDRRSDTRIFAEDLIPGLDLGDADVRGRLGEWMGVHNKVVILTVNPRYPRNSYIVNESSGEWIGGAWYSNPDYLVPIEIAYASAYGKATALDTVGIGRAGAGHADETWPGWYGECWICCSRKDVDNERVMCMACNICLDCGQDWDTACECYMYPDPWEKRRGGDLDAIPAELEIVE